MNGSRAADLECSTTACLGTLISDVVIIDVTTSLKPGYMASDQHPIAKCERANIDW
jgi:hypothetical protein